MGSLKNETKRHNEGLQVELSRFNTRRLLPSFFHSDWGSKLEQEFAYRRIEGGLIQSSRESVASSLETAPSGAQEFSLWLQELPYSGAQEWDPIFEWLETKASPTQVKRFIRQEAFAEVHLEECILLTSIRMPRALGMDRLKVTVFSMLAEEFGPSFEERVHPECRAISNLMMGMASNRYYAFQSLGALSLQPGLTARRLHSLGMALSRMGIECILPSRPRWIQDSIFPLLNENPDLRIPIAEGALMRMQAASECYRAYRESWIKPDPAGA